MARHRISRQSNASPPMRSIGASDSACGTRPPIGVQVVHRGPSSRDGHLCGRLCWRARPPASQYTHIPYFHATRGEGGQLLRRSPLLGESTCFWTPWMHAHAEWPPVQPRHFAASGRRQRGLICQPKATPWVHKPSAPQAPAGRDNGERRFLLRFSQAQRDSHRLWFATETYTHVFGPRRSRHAKPVGFFVLASG